MAENYFALASWFWTTVLSYSIYCIIAEGKMRFKLWQAKIFCWGFPLVLIALPLSMVNYGSGDPDVQWCEFVQRSGSLPYAAVYWSYWAFFVWLFLCVFLIIFWGTLIRIRYQGTIFSKLVRKTYSKVWLYPVAMIGCWLMNYFFIGVDPSASSTPLVFLSMLFGISYGIFSTIIFILNSPEILRRWWRLVVTVKDRSRFAFAVTRDSDSPSVTSEDLALLYLQNDSDFTEEEVYTGNFRTLSAVEAGANIQMQQKDNVLSLLHISPSLKAKDSSTSIASSSSQSDAKAFG
jgi:hypothetical protein